MGDRHDYVALEWVKGEIRETLKLAQNALETYVEHPDAVTSMQACSEYIHQVHGSLKMVEFFGAALLAEEMEQLAQALAAQKVANISEALEVMMQAVLQLPLYIEQVQTARHDLPLVILPLLNDLRAARDEQLLSETSLFAPKDLQIPAALSDAELRKLQVNDLPSLLRKMRQIFQMALVGVLREQDVERNLLYLKRVFTHLENLSKKAPLSILWQLSSALVDGLSSGRLACTASIRRLLREIDAYLRILVDEELSAFNHVPRQELLKNLLFYIAKAKGGSELIDKLVIDYQLETAFPDIKPMEEGETPIVDRGAMRSVVVALSEELMRIKDALDIFVRGDRKNYNELARLQTPMKQVADTLAVIGVPNLRQMILSQIDILAHYEQSQESISDNTLMDVAGAILFVEVSLNNMVDHEDQEHNEQTLLPTTDVQKIHHLVIKEAHTGLAQVKDHIIGFITSQWDQVHLSSIPALLNQVRGALVMIPLLDAAKIIERCNLFIEQKLIHAQTVPNWHILDTLADIITGVEYYLECLVEDSVSTTEEALNVARQGLVELGYSVDAELLPELTPPAPTDIDLEPVVEVGEDIFFDATPTAAEEDIPVLSIDQLESELTAANLSYKATEAEDDINLDSSELVFDDNRLELAEEDSGIIDLTAFNETDTDLDGELGLELSEPESIDLTLELEQEANIDLLGEAELVSAEADNGPEITASEQTMTIAQVMAQPVREINPQAKSVPETLLPPPADEEPIDEELREIFVEEAGEVQETIAEYYPQWKEDTDNNTALTEVRRAFHTLKGSGRMVRALVIGELAWSIENMLNRVIDGTISITDDLFQVIDNVLAILPSLIKEFEEQAQRQRDDVDLYASIAHALSRNQPIPVLEMDAVVENSETEPAIEPALQEREESLANAAPLLEEVEIPVLQEIAPEPRLSEAEQRLQAEQALDPILMEIFAQETETHLEAFQYFLNKCAVHLPQAFPEEIQRALHTLKGSAKMAEVTPIADIVSPLEKLAKEYKASLWMVNQVEYDLLRDSYALLVKGLRQLSTTPLRPIDGAQALIERIEDVNQQFNAYQTAQPIPTADEQSAENTELDPPSQRDLAACSDLLFSTEETLENWRENPHTQPDVQQLIADLNKLSGYAQAAQLPQIARYAEVLAQLYHAVESGEIPVSATFFAEAASAHAGLINMMDQFMAGLDVEDNPLPITNLESFIKLNQVAPSVSSERKQITTSTEPVISSQKQADTSAFEVDYKDELVEIFIEEAVDVTESANNRLEQWLLDPQDDQQLTALMRDLHTLKGGARMAGIEPVGNLAHAAESLYESIIQGRCQFMPELASIVQKAHDDLAQMVELLQAKQPLFNASQSLHALEQFTHTENVIENINLTASVIPEQEIESGSADLKLAEDSFELPEFETAPRVEDIVLDEAVSIEPSLVPEKSAKPAQNNPTFSVDYTDEMIDIFLEEASDISESANNQLETWLENPTDISQLSSLMRDLHTLKGGARMAGLQPLGDLAHETESIYEGLISGKYAFEPNLAELLHRAHDEIAQLVELLVAKQPLFIAESTFRSFKTFRETGQVELPSTSITEPSITEAPTASTTQSTRDPELVEIFLDEAVDLLDNATHSLQNWVSDPNNLAQLASMQRDMHTIKGGARMAEIPEIANLAHELEFIYEDLSTERLKATHALFELMQETHDMLSVLLDQTKADKALTDTSELLLRIKRVRDPNARLEHLVQVAGAEHVDPTTALVTARVAAAQAQSDKQESKLKVLPFLAKNQEQKEQSSQQDQDEQVRVSSGLLEELVNLAGETSIFRGRIEQQISGFLFTLGEMDATIERVRDQLRRMDMETQAQIISRHHEELSDIAGSEYFDPLEMDQYSQLQQLSRSLFESASDLSDLKETLALNVRDTETLLLQQARINTELQEGLMRTRMVPFDRLLPRLRRIVRQISGELDKKVNFDVRDNQGEMDRTVMERMVAPLEHLLRNAIDHGVEPAEKRQQQGKTAVGNITLTITREGGDILMVLADDGAGVNIDAVRKKAIERGFITADQNLTDHEVVQLILRSGLSTAKQLTQISGRGVGMDVVNSQIKQLGGSVEIESHPGKGTNFLIRLPFTVSVDRALMVIAGEDLYAVPLNTIDGIVRVPPRELEALYKQAEQAGQAYFEYAGHSYALRYIGELLQNGQRPKLEGQVLPLPVILVRGSEYSVAVQVDILSGSREIVVKSLGAQFSSVRGISGATILGDGRVVVILDLLAMIRSRQVQQIDIPEVKEEKEERRIQVMVVDDSVTVRKVTSRLLERNQMDVITAKDGADAIAQLQEASPDIMLLDIEMPRMDGFEVARLVRHNDRIKDLPIIMITSRTGDKHRERAFSLGVNEYLGKPFQENLLLETIYSLLGQKR
ncbi:Hpt domain-containing protein [Pseudomonas sp. F1_0610]|uniref:hybrid sensor histidine kinase/response regulator n=1 Tax=Pseudomonas sp. F1_0610 TaxID=3114284 RepID=UPI0039C004B0